jgi:hypothetical protein
MTTTEVISICAVFIAALALIATFFQAHIGRKHNILSVKPHLTIGHNVRQNGKPIEYEITNNGLGPAIITYHAIVIDGREYDLNNHLDDGPENLFKKIGIDFTGRSWSMNVYPTDGALSAGKTEVILGFPSCHIDNEFTSSLQSVLPRISFLIKYKCIYGNDFVANSE